MKFPYSIVHKMLLMVIMNFIFTHGTIAQVTIMDSKHYSTVFGEMRNFRIFLPNDYSKSPQKKYPVIYFLHGWSQRYFGSGEDSYAAYD